MVEWRRCSKCNKPLVCEGNWRKLRKIILISTASAGIMGALTLPLLGFGAGGVAKGSAAAAWQSYIGVVAAGSLFAFLQSVGATGVGILLFGSAVAALGLLTSSATRLGWCNGDCNGPSNSDGSQDDW